MGAFRNAFDTHDSKRRVDERDDSGERIIAGRRATGRAAMSESALQQAVSSDLQTLMNTTCLESTLDLGDCDEVRRSVLNYGLPDIVHRTIDESSLVEIKAEIRTALEAHEPRLDPGSIRVERDMRIAKGELRVRFVVRADLRCDPLNLPVEFVADVEQSTGKILITGQ